MQEERDIATTYFDVIPGEISGRILQYISERPRHRLWLASVSVANLGALLSIPSIPLRTELERATKHLVFTHRKTPSYNGHNNNIHSAGNTPAVHIHPTEDATYLPEVVSTMCANAAEVTFDKLALRDVHAVDLIDIVARHCANLKTLRISDFLSDDLVDNIMYARGGELEELSLSFSGYPVKSRESYWQLVWQVACSMEPLPRTHIIGRQLDSIADNTVNLRKLNLDYLSTTSVRLWYVLGPKLEELTLRFSPVCDSVRTLVHVKIHCRKLHTVEVMASSTGFTLAESDSVTMLYASYGAQLRKASLQDIDPACCPLVRSECPNARCSVGHMYRCDEQLEILGPLVSEIRFDHLWNNVETTRGEVLRAATKECNKVVKIHGRVLGTYCLWSLDTFAALMDRPYVNLEVFIWPKWLIHKDNLPEALHALGNCTGALRELTMTFEGWELGMMDELIGNNRRTLQKVHLHLGPDIFFEVAVILDIISSFARCRRLDQLVITFDGGETTARHIGRNERRIRELLRKIEDRGIFVRIGNIDYLK